MVDVKNYDEYDDFLQHKKECDLFFGNIKNYTFLEGKLIIDFCSGTGNHIGFLAKSGAKFIVGLDIADNSVFYNHEIKNSICNYFRKHGYNIEVGEFDCIQADAQVTSIKKASADIVFCVNAFEHIPDPEKALLEIYRILKPGGYAFISFIPVWNCDIGSHMGSFIEEPWAHLKFPEEEYIEILKNATNDSEYWINEFKCAMNRLPRNYYFSLFAKYCENFRNFHRNNHDNATSRITHCFSSVRKKFSQRKHFVTLEFHEWTGVFQEKNLHHQNFFELQKKYSKDELLFQGCYTLLKKT